MSKRDRDDRRAARAQEAIRAQRAAERRRRFAVIGVVVLVAAIVVGGFLIQAGRDSTPATADAPKGVTDGYAVTRGDASAPVRLTVYEDLQCPICEQLETAAGAQIKQAAADGKVYVEYRPMAFINDYSTRALNALAAVLDTSGNDAAIAFHDLSFADQPSESGPYPSDADLVDRAVEAGATESAVKPLIDDQAFEGWVKKATDAASKNKVNGTPTVFIDGKLVDWTSIPELAQKIQQAIDAG